MPSHSNNEKKKQNSMVICFLNAVLEGKLILE